MDYFLTTELSGCKVFITDKCSLQVLNLWLERKVMPDSVLRHFMTEIESHNDDKDSSGNGPRRLSRSERAVDDPVREMEGMLVDEYGR